ncbi:MAG: Flp family type IVb pilin [Janthinobacterium lividum]
MPSSFRSSLTHAAACFLRDEDGATLVEYVLLVALIAAVCVAAVSLLGTSANTRLNTAATSLQ